MLIQTLKGDCRDVLKTLPDNSVNCCVASPPYFGLRDYGAAGQIGLEETPAEYVAALVGVFREVKRVLRADGTCWLNLGDCYGTGTKAARQPGQRGLGENTQKAQDIPRIGGQAKQLLGIPWRVAFALQEDGWWLRSEIIWHKPNAMPESVTDRPTKSHEQIFLLTKSSKYFYDAAAIAEPQVKGNAGSDFSTGKTAIHQLNRSSEKEREEDGLRNKRTVWTVSTIPYPGSHFATFPEKLIEPCILAGCPEGGTVLDPFAGSGTTLRVAAKHSRNAIGIELNGEYRKLIDQRTDKVQIKMAI